MGSQHNWGIYEIKEEQKTYLGDIEGMNREEIFDMMRGTTPIEKINTEIVANNDYILVDEVKNKAYILSIK